ncbi:MAG TPA: 4-hydroxythreonine-4-phosphate dehydrogenase PdxA [Afifellaceae bacterium]|nr:4-hydroxythreonine-4-phosphate dehydrogenase PdxA [Afifellaceae bacterium]
MSLPLALTLGEPSGIGPDVAIFAWLARKEANVPAFFLIGDAAFMERRAKAMGHSIPIRMTLPGETAAIFDDALPCLADTTAVAGRVGDPDPNDAAAVIAAIRQAVELVHAGLASAVVTNPIYKAALTRTGFGFPGHTEYLGALSNEVFGVAARPVMMIAAPMLKVIPVTIHIPLAAVPQTLTRETIVTTGRIVAHDLVNRFGIDNPRLVVSGLNPHAGENGILGSEDATIVEPAVADLVADGINASGPWPADSMFHEAARSSYDAALCMYHDQALIPVKALAFDEAVNVTLGLPFIRTSPDHGTALPLAGTGRASADSLIAALKLAADLAGGPAASRSAGAA